MKINVKSGREVWKSPDGQRKIYEVTLDNGTKLQTFSEKINAGGEFEVETYERNGRSYVRQIPKQQEKQFKADPASRESIEWQTSLKAAVEVARDFYIQHEFAGSLEDYAKEVDKVAVHFKNLITLKPTSVYEPEDTDAGDFAKINDDTPDLPPVDQLKEPF